MPLLTLSLVQLFRHCQQNIVADQIPREYTPENFSNEVLAVADGGLARSRGEDRGAGLRRGHIAVRNSHFALAR